MTTSSPPPVPTAVQERYLLAWHPGDGAWWLVTHQHGVWRVARDGAGEAIADESAVGEPTGLHEILYFDAARASMVHVALPEADEPLQVAVWDGAAFTPRELAGASAASERDGVVFDPRRGVLVHLRAPAAEDEPLTVSELGGDGRWRASAVSLAFGGEGMICGWDASKARVIVIDAATSATHAYDGAGFTRLDDFPRAVSGWPWTTFTAPRSGHLVLLRFAPYMTPDELLRSGAELWELAGRTWRARSAGTLEVFGGGAHDPAGDVAAVFGPWFGPGTQQRSLATYDGERLVGAGLACVELAEGSVAGPVRFWGQREAARASADREVRRLYASQVIHELVDGRLVERANSPAATMAIFNAAGACHALTDEGALHRLEDGAWRLVAAGHAAFGLRRRACVGADGRGRVLALGGESEWTGKHETTGFLFDGAAWQSLPGKGLPVVTAARVVADERSDTWLLVGARDRKGKDDGKVHELAAGKWHSHPSSISAHIVSEQLLAWDAASQQVLLIATLVDASHESSTRFYVYRGAGRWDDRGPVEVGGGPAAYDDTRRVVVSALEGRLSELDVAPLLDAAARAASEPVEPGKAARKAGTKRPAAPKRREPVTAHLIRFVKRGRDHYGGLPKGVTAERWPLCKSCGAAMQHVLALRAHASRLPLQRHAGLAVFVCNAGKACASWDPDAGCNAVLLLSKKQLAGEPLAEPPRGARRQKPSPVVEQCNIGYKARLEADPDADDVEALEAASKVGGYPVWVQAPQVPTCDECEAPMRFVAQLMEETDEVNFGGGDGYLFCCGEEHQAKFLWQQ